MNPAFIRAFDEISQDDLLQIGGKAASLGELTQAGIKVPPGFVISTDALKSGLTPELEQSILKAFKTLNAPRVSVRSSAVAEDSEVASWAGQLDTYLNVTSDDLIASVKKCLDSVSSERAMAYAKAHAIDVSQNAVAVVVMAMVDSDISGIMFTANPVNGARDELVIEAALGLGELLAQGEVTPESIITTRDGKITNRIPSRQHTKLIYKNGANHKEAITPPEEIVTPHLLKQLIEAAIKIERHYHAPQDIEWVLADGKLYIVQSRPVTTLV